MAAWDYAVDGMHVLMVPVLYVPVPAYDRISYLCLGSPPLSRVMQPFIGTALCPCRQESRRSGVIISRKRARRTCTGPMMRTAAGGLCRSLRVVYAPALADATGAASRCVGGAHILRFYCCLAAQINYGYTDFRVCLVPMPWARRCTASPRPLNGSLWRSGCKSYTHTQHGACTLTQSTSSRRSVRVGLAMARSSSWM